MALTKHSLPDWMWWSYVVLSKTSINISNCLYVWPSEASWISLRSQFKKRFMSSKLLKDNVVFILTSCHAVHTAHALGLPSFFLPSFRLLDSNARLDGSHIMYISLRGVETEEQQHGHCQLESNRWPADFLAAVMSMEAANLYYFPKIGCHTAVSILVVIDSKRKSPKPNAKFW